MEHKSGDTIRKISKLGNIIMICALGLSCLCIFLFVLTAIVLIITPGLIPDDVSIDELAFHLCAGSVGCAIMAIVFFLLAKLTDNMHENSSPFTIDNVNIMKRIALVLVVGFIVDSIVRAGLSVIFEVSDSEISLSPTSLVFAAIIYFLALIFQYGVELQEESDSFL